MSKFLTICFKIMEWKKVYKQKNLSGTIWQDLRILHHDVMFNNYYKKKEKGDNFLHKNFG